MRTVPVRGAERVDERVLADVQRVFATCVTLADVLRWAGQQIPRAHVAEIVTQDEYTHDVVLPFGPAFLSFDTT
jgi:hypothetical protein